MWSVLARNILRHRLIYLTALVLITITFGFFASKIEMSYDFPKILPSDDKSEIAYNEFRKIFGEDGTVMVIGYKTDDLFSLKKFNEWSALADSINHIKGIENVLSLDKAYGLKKNDSLKKFEYFPIVSSKPNTQKELVRVRVPTC